MHDSMSTYPFLSINFILFILKFSINVFILVQPDITAPGVNIIAAFSQARSPTDQSFDKRKVPFITESGTSMSCPHVAGVVGLLKTLYPDWSSSAIRSAIMTTGDETNVNSVVNSIF